VARRSRSIGPGSKVAGGAGAASRGSARRIRGRLRGEAPQLVTRDVDLLAVEASFGVLISASLASRRSYAWLNGGRAHEPSSLSDRASGCNAQQSTTPVRITASSHGRKSANLTA
jgi:hypothetical protein